MADYRSTGKELRKSPKGLIAGILAVVIIGAAGCGLLHVMNNLEPVAPASDSEPEISLSESETASEEDAEAIDFGFEAIPVTEIKHGPLALVNHDCPTEDLETGIVTIFDNKNEFLNVKDMTVTLHTDALDALNKMAAAFHEATGHADLMVMEGYLTKQTQKEIYEADLQRTGATGSQRFAIPGCSEMESGYSFDLSVYANGIFQDFTGEGDYEWIMKHCAEYGFVQRFPADKESITKISDQTSVFRYVGKPHAWYMYKNHLCMEEYADLLETYPQDGTHLTVSDQLGQLFEVYYVSIDPNDPSPEAVVPVPIGYKFSVSGNNRHGFIVTIVLGRQADADNSSAPAKVSSETKAGSPEDADASAA